MKNFNNFRKIWGLEGVFRKNRYILWGGGLPKNKGLGQFADLMGRLDKKEGGAEGIDINKTNASK